MRIIISSSDPRDRYTSARILLLRGSANGNSHFWNEQQDPLRIAVRLGDLDMCHLLVSIGKMSPLSALTRGDKWANDFEGYNSRESGEYAGYIVTVTHIY